jgi:hypothetical protein
LAIFVVVAVSIAVNSASGAFLTVVHQHDHGHVHTHDDGDTRSADASGAVDPTWALSTADDRSAFDRHGPIHDHGSSIVLALVDVGGLVPVDGGRPPGVRPETGTRCDVRHPLERPPRTA